jgi:hypothetical protein
LYKALRRYIAQEAASALRQHLLDKPLDDMTGFERVVRDGDGGVLWTELEAMSTCRPPRVMWRGNGAFKNLFRFFALRFLGNSDSALKAEGIHSQWQWLLRSKFSIKHKLLNAMLKIGYCTHNGSMPEASELVKYFLQARRTFWDMLKHVPADVGKGFKNKWAWLSRFNVSVEDAMLLKGPAIAASPAAADASPEVRWANYCRFTLVPLHFYTFSNLKAGTFFFVGENKSLPGRATKHDDEATGRSIAVCWFEIDGEDDGGGTTYIKRVACEHDGMQLMLCSIAELLRAAGCVRDTQDLSS